MKSFITWLFVKYVYTPAQKERVRSDQPRDYIIEFEPAPEWEAQIEKNCTKPKIH